jgi:hypothetical protein
VAGISSKSDSFLRYDRGNKPKKEFSIGINIEQDFLDKYNAIDLRKWIIEFYNGKAVIQADKISLKTKQEIMELRYDIKDFLEDTLKSYLYPDNVKGIVDIHPVGDKTEKSSHIHWWGNHPKITSRLISKFVLENNLSVKSTKRFSIYKLNDDIFDIDVTWSDTQERDFYNFLDENEFYKDNQTDINIVDESYDKIDLISSKSEINKLIYQKELIKNSLKDVLIDDSNTLLTRLDTLISLDS